MGVPGLASRLAPFSFDAERGAAVWMSGSERRPDGTGRENDVESAAWVAGRGPDGEHVCDKTHTIMKLETLPGFAHVTALVPSLSLAAVLGVAYDELTAL